MELILGYIVLKWNSSKVEMVTSHIYKQKLRGMVVQLDRWQHCDPNRKDMVGS